MKNIISAVVLVMLSVTVSFPAFALGGLEFLSKAPVSYFTPEDSELFKNTLYDLLDNQPDGKTVKWLNQETGHSGKMQSTKSFTIEELPCRTVKIFHSAGGMTGQGKFDFCKQGEGSWKIAP